MERLNRVPQAAEKLTVSPKTLWAWIGSRKIGVHRVGRAVRISESEIERILAEGFTPARGESPQNSPRVRGNVS
jgi:excisionase family DNA binding protein